MQAVGNIAHAIYLQNSVDTLMKLAERPNIHPLIDALFPPEKGHTLTFL